MKLPALKIGKLVAEVPIVQGGMAIRLSTAPLAAAVANEGGIGLIAASGMSFDELRKEIRMARKLTGGKGIIGINAMVAARQFLGLIKTAAEEMMEYGTTVQSVMEMSHRSKEYQAIFDGPQLDL